MNSVEAYYDQHSQLEWERFDRHRMEFAITKRALARYLPPPPAKILDCGGGPGRYSIYLTQQGYQVTLLDLSEGNLTLARTKSCEEGVEIAEILHGNALDLSQLEDGQFDAVLLFGPLYHLLKEQDRSQAVCEALRVLKPGGPLFAAFITLYAPFRDAIAKGYRLDMVENPGSLTRFLETQSLSQGFTDAWFTNPSEIIPWMESFSLKTEAILDVEGLAAGHEQHLNALDEKSLEFWVDLNYQFCTDPHLWGAADHLLYIGIS